jgi:hypothetical protein
MSIFFNREKSLLKYVYRNVKGGTFGGRTSREGEQTREDDEGVNMFEVCCIHV